MYISEVMELAKYHNKKVIANGVVFDSQKEAQRYQELLLLEKAGEITDLKRQEKFVVIPKQLEDYSQKKGKVIERECVYIADFTYYRGEEFIVEDVKGVKTKDYIIKRKLMLYQFGIRVTEVS